MPPVSVTVSTPPATLAVAVGEPAPADVNTTVFADKLCGALPPRVMRTALPVGTASAGVSDTVIVTALVPLATLLSVMDGAFAPRDPLIIATHVPLLVASSVVPPLFVMAVAKLIVGLMAINGFLTVPGSRSVIGTPPASVPTENVMVRIFDDTAAIAAGDPAVGVITLTVFAERLKAKLPVKVMKILPLFGIAFRGVTDSVMETDDADVITLLKVMLGRWGGGLDAESTMAGKEPVWL